MGSDVADQCTEMIPLVTQWADQTLERAQEIAVAAHLAVCPACRTTAERERAVRQVLRERAPRLREPAPEGLRTRLQGVTGHRVLAWNSARRRSAWQLPLAASLLLGLAGAGLFGALAPPGTVLAAQLALDHLKCQFLAHDEPDARPEALEARWTSEQGWNIRVPPGDPAVGLELMGLRRCLFSGGSMAHVMYELKGRHVSLFVLDESRQSAPALAIMGHETVTWSAGGRTLALVGDLPPDELATLASRFRQHP